MVINGVANANEPQWQILHSEQFSSPQAVRDIINGISMEEPPQGMTFEDWVTKNALTERSDGPSDDADEDGWANALEFSAGTDPQDRESFPVHELRSTENGFTLTYTRFVPAIDLVRTWEMGPLGGINTELIPEEGEIVVEPIEDLEIERVMISLPPDFGPFIQLKVGIE